MKKLYILKVTLFLVIGAMMVGILNYFCQPVWKSYNNYNTMHGFYEEPEDTIETIFLGASITVNAISPSELYRDYGICAYNLGTEEQPMMASYYWLLETDRLHRNTLKTVVLDASMLRRTPGAATYQKALDGMKLSSVKMKAIIDHSDNWNDIILYIFPALEYHSRWNSFNITDFEKKNYKTNTGVRGYNFITDRMLEKCSYEEMLVPQYYVDVEAGSTELDKESLYYLKKIVDYCNDNDLRFVLMKTPAIRAWSSSDHNAVEIIAEDYNLDFIDFNFEPYIDEINYNEALDNKDGTHLNYYGARKVTKWFGDYLVSECDSTDVKNDEKYTFMDSELAEYEAYINGILNLKESTNLIEYLSAAMINTDNTILLTVKDEASRKLEEDVRKQLSEIGLKVLSEIGYGDSYIGIIDDGKIVYEQVDKMEDYQESLEDKQEEIEKGNINSLENLDLYEIKEEKKKEKEATEITYSYNITKEISANLKSAGYMVGNVASCMLDGQEYALNTRGINIVVYNKSESEVIDSRTFDTYENEKEVSWDLEMELNAALKDEKMVDELPDKLRWLYLYDKRCEERRME